tara:strand:+ start:1410 stop:2012 length:603 start_codon:yes stop_codon:yes gene_type:complete
MAKKLKQLTERTKIEIVPTPGQDKGQNVSYKNVVQPGEKAFVDKHVVQKTDYPVPEKNAGDKNAIFSGAKQTKKKRLADQENEAGSEMYEAAANKKAEEIVTAMKRNKSDFVKRYGDEAKSVMYATANKMSTEEVEEDEDFINIFELHDGSEIELEDDLCDLIDEVYESLSEDHQEQFDALFNENRQTNSSLLEWVRSVA